MNCIIDHQWKSILELNPDLKEKIIKMRLENPTIEIRLVFKYGKFAKILQFIHFLCMIVHPRLDIVNEPVRHLLITISSHLQYQGKVFL